MARKRVIAHFMHETEAGAVVPRLTDSVVTPGFAIGDIEEAEMPGLRDRGIIFQEIAPPPPPPPHPPEHRARMASVASAMASIEGMSIEGLDLPPAGPPTSSDTYYLTLAGPLVPAWRMQLEGVGVHFRVARGTDWVVRISSWQLATVRALPFVTGLAMRGSDHNLPTRGEFVPFAAAKEEVRKMATYDVLLDQDTPLGEFLGWLRERNIAVAGAEGNKARIYLLDNDPLLAEISQLTDWVIDIQPYVPPKLHNDRARVLLGVDAPPAAGPATHLPLEGETEIVAIADTGLDSTHSDIPAARVAGVVALGRPGDASDPHGHGTHVTGSVLGDGTASGGSIRGVAPRARLYFQSLLDKEGGLGGLPFRLGTLFAAAYAAGARIHNNSWGATAMAAYRVSSREVDEYVHSQKDMLIVMSAGNEGTAADPPVGTRKSADGFVDWLSIAVPATAKNALTVGASRSDRLTGGLAKLTYGAIWPLTFAKPPIATDTISGNPGSIAGFSSRGPCDDYRIKPDVVAPGTDILSCRSSTAPLRVFWSVDPAHPQYAYWGGTSMAAPLVSGCAALVRQYYTQHRQHNPSAALLKATLINSTRWLAEPSAVAEFPNRPNYHQGFGCVSMPMAVPDPGNPGFTLWFYDNWQTPAGYFSATGENRRFRFDLTSAGWLRITLAYTDPPGRGLQNNLNLFLQLPDGSKKYGNMDVPLGLGRPDSINNVEVLRLDNAPAGGYWIQVVATNLLQPQDFAMVVTGNSATPLTEV